MPSLMRAHKSISVSMPIRLAELIERYATQLKTTRSDFATRCLVRGVPILVKEVCAEFEAREQREVEPVHDQAA